MANSMAWLAAGRPVQQAWEALVLLEGATSHGLDPADYPTDALGRALQAARQGQEPPLVLGLPLEQALTSTFQHYLRDLHQGRIDPQQVHENFRPARRASYDAKEALEHALITDQLSWAVQQAAPQLPLYEQLRSTLARYRQLVGHLANAPLPLAR